MKKTIRKFVGIDINEETRNQWLKYILNQIPAGKRILDAGAGELRNKPLCKHLDYVSQDFGKFSGSTKEDGLQTKDWDTSKIDIVCDITDIPESAASFDAILCSEVFEHLPDALGALNEFERLLKPGGLLIITAPFASFVHFAPYHYATGFSRYWYEYHLPRRNFEITELTPNGGWFSYLKQEMLRFPAMARRYNDWCWPLAYLVSVVGLIYFSIRLNPEQAEDVACFGWHCTAVKH